MSVSLLLQLRKQFEGERGAVNTLNVSIRYWEKMLFSILAFIYKEPLIATLNLWSKKLDPYRQSFIKELLVYTLNKEDKKALEDLQKTTLPFKQVLEKSLFTPEFSDPLKALLCLYGKKNLWKLPSFSGGIIAQEVLSTQNNS